MKTHLIQKETRNKDGFATNWAELLQIVQLLIDTPSTDLDIVAVDWEKQWAPSFMGPNGKIRVQYSTMQFQIPLPARTKYS